MIHTIEIDPSSRPDELRKLFRKRLMTGGAVFRIKPGLTVDEQRTIYQTFLPRAVDHNIESDILCALANAPDLHEDLVPALAKTNIKPVLFAINRRGLSA